MRLNTPPLAMVNPPWNSPPRLTFSLQVQFRVPPLAIVTAGDAFTEGSVPPEVNAMFMVSLPAGTPGGDQFPGSCQLSSTAPVHVLVAACEALVPDSSTVANTANAIRAEVALETCKMRVVFIVRVLCS
jgi:hypothetical protein